MVYTLKEVSDEKNGECYWEVVFYLAPSDALRDKNRVDTYMEFGTRQQVHDNAEEILKQYEEEMEG